MLTPNLPLFDGRTTPPVRAVIDSDTYNEIDDQFALVYALLAPEQIHLEAIYAAPFYFPALNSRSESPADGMEKSYEEILRVLGRVPGGVRPEVFRGASGFLSALTVPARSAAAGDLVSRARAGPAGERLWVFGIAALTNVASALLLDPGIADHIVVIWLGGHPHAWPDRAEFNLAGDPLAAQVVVASGVPFVQIPCKNVAEHLRTTVPEMATCVRGCGEIGAYLYQIFSEYENAGDRAGPAGWSKPVWDIACIAAVVVPSAFSFRVIGRPRLTDDLQWLPAGGRGEMTVADDLNRNLIFGDFFSRLAARANHHDSQPARPAAR